MHTFLVLVVTVSVVAADVGLGYHYNVPTTSYGVPSYQLGGGGYNSGFSGASTASSLGTGTGFNYNGLGSGSGSNYYNTFGSGYQGSSLGSGGGYQGSSLASTAGLTGFQTGLDSHAQTAGLDAIGNYYQTASAVANQPSYQAFNQYETSDQYQSSAVQKYQEYYTQQQPAQVYKHFYIHAAPEEPETPKIRQPIVLPAPQKHYKIIFIKTPAQQAPAPQIIPVPSQNEEKTIVYVLVKKPEDAQNIVLPKIEQKAPTKPEVFFIKYNNKQESQAVIDNIVNDYNKGGVSASFAGSGTSDGSYASSGSTGTLDSFGSTESAISQVFGGGSSGSYGSGGSSSGTFGSGGLTSGTFGTGGTSFGTGSSTGSFGSSSSLGSGSTLGSGTSFGSGSSGSYGQNYGLESSSVGYGLGSATGGYDSSTLGGISSTTASSVSSGYDASAISTSQGVPHETYGPPKFKVF